MFGDDADDGLKVRAARCGRRARAEEDVSRFQEDILADGGVWEDLREASGLGRTLVNVHRLVTGRKEAADTRAEPLKLAEADVARGRLTPKGAHALPQIDEALRGWAG